MFLNRQSHLTIFFGVGPGLIAISFIMFAYCLRAWRRNGIACDELIFLPGTAHAEKAAEPRDEVRLPLNLRHGSPSRDSRHSNSPIRARSNDEESGGDTVDDMNVVELVETPTPLSPTLTSTVPSDSIEEQTEYLNTSIEETEMVPLNIEKEEKLYSPAGLWRNCRRPNNARSRSPQTSSGDSNQEQDKVPYSPKKEAKGIGRFFSSSRETNEYAPSGPIVASAGVDLCMPVLLNFHMFVLFTHTSGDADGDNGMPPQVLPIIFLSILMARSCIPFGSRKRFWKTINSAICAPFDQVTFRDELISEVATSMVRPLQDIFFALFWYVVSFYGIFTGKMELEETGSKLQHSIVLYNVVLPTCAVLPLLCRFLQTLRQAVDEQRRWPYLGNAFKYLSASLVIMYGMTHNEEERSWWWIYCFGACLLYQTWWDIVIDWELLQVIPREEYESSFLPCIPRIRLRSKRLFKSSRSYWRIIAFNVIFRFTWMLSFIPAQHINLQSGEIEHTFSMDFKSFLGFAVAFTELLRRCLWTILRLELETIKISHTRYTGNVSAIKSSRINYSWLAPCGDESAAMQRSDMKWAAYRLMVRRLFWLELFFWIAAFIGLGLWVGAFLE